MYRINTQRDDFIQNSTVDLQSLINPFTVQHLCGCDNPVKRVILTVLKILTVSFLNRFGSTVMLRLTTGIQSEIFVIRRFCHCANITVCTYTKLDCITYYIPRLYGIASCS